MYDKCIEYACLKTNWMSCQRPELLGFIYNVRSLFHRSSKPFLSSGIQIYSAIFVLCLCFICTECSYKLNGKAATIVLVLLCLSLCFIQFLALQKSGGCMHFFCLMLFTASWQNGLVEKLMDTSQLGHFMTCANRSTYDKPLQCFVSMI